LVLLSLALLSFSHHPLHLFYLLFFFNATATTEIYTLSLHDALPIFLRRPSRTTRSSSTRRPLPMRIPTRSSVLGGTGEAMVGGIDRKSTRLNSSHVAISYAVFCLKKKKKNNINEIKIKVDITDTDRR